MWITRLAALCGIKLQSMIYRISCTRYTNKPVDKDFFVFVLFVLLEPQTRIIIETLTQI